MRADISIFLGASKAAKGYGFIACEAFPDKERASCQGAIGSSLSVYLGEGLVDVLISSRMYVYTHIKCICVYIYMYRYVYTYIHINMYRYVYTYIHINMYICL